MGLRRHDPAIVAQGITKSFRVREGAIGTGTVFGRANWVISPLAGLFGRCRPRTAVDAVDLKVPAGALVGLLGPNGAGKTTLLKCLTTLLVPDSGTAFVNGYDVSAEADAVRTSVNLVGSTHWAGFDWGLTVRENLEFFGTLYHVERTALKTRMGEVLELVGLSEHADDTPGDLSSGERQKMLLAKGFLIDAPILLLDEPTVGLDPRSSHEVRTYIREVLAREQCLTVVLSTHHMFEAQELCDRVAVMDSGRIIAYDAPSALCAQVREHDVVVIEARVEVERLVKIVGAECGVRRVAMVSDSPDDRTTVLHLICDDGEAVCRRVITRLLGMGVNVERAAVEPPTLEDAFLLLTGKGLDT